MKLHLFPKCFLWPVFSTILSQFSQQILSRNSNLQCDKFVISPWNRRRYSDYEKITSSFIRRVYMFWCKTPLHFITFYRNSSDVARQIAAYVIARQHCYNGSRDRDKNCTKNPLFKFVFKHLPSSGCNPLQLSIGIKIRKINDMPVTGFIVDYVTTDALQALIIIKSWLIFHFPRPS